MEYGKDFYEYLIGNEKTEGYEIEYLSGPDIISFGRSFGDYPYVYNWGGMNLSRWDYMKRLINFVEEKINLDSFFHLYFVKKIIKNNIEKEKQELFIRDINNRLISYGQKINISNGKIIVEKVAQETILDDIELDLTDDTKKDELVGEGGQAEILTTDDKDILIKKLRNLPLRNDKDKARFIEEYRLLKLYENKKHIIEVFDLDETDYSYTMRRADGSFTELSNDLSDDEIVKYLYQTVENVMYIHSKNMFHRDIKGQNCLRVNNRWVLCDFGYSKTHDSPSNTTTGTAFGTPGYVHPEIIENGELWKNGYKPKYDIYQLGKLILNDRASIKDEIIREDILNIGEKCLKDSIDLSEILKELKTIFVNI